LTKTGISEEDIREGEKLGPYWGESPSSPEDFDESETEHEDPVEFDENAIVVDGSLTIEELIEEGKSSENRNPCSQKSASLLARSF